LERSLEDILASFFHIVSLDSDFYVPTVT
jgi:hypothetical protein